jgi:hypothetical protein
MRFRWLFSASLRLRGANDSMILSSGENFMALPSRVAGFLALKSIFTQNYFCQPSRYETDLILLTCIFDVSRQSNDSPNVPSPITSNVVKLYHPTILLCFHNFHVAVGSAGQNTPAYKALVPSKPCQRNLAIKSV